MADSLAVEAILRHLPVPSHWNLHVFDHLASTNTLALGWAAKNAPHGTVLLAESQSAGRGRGHRIWRTPRGTALALSVILRPSIELDRVPWIGLAAALATVDAIEAVTGLQCRVKWPNDVLIGQRKVAGILTECRFKTENAPPAVVVGIGVNVNNRAAAFPEDIRTSATSLLDAGGSETDRNQLAAALLDALIRWVGTLRHGVEEVSGRWMMASATLGQHLAVLTPDGVVEGADRGLDPTGCLMLEQRDGVRRAIHSGEVLLCRTAVPPLV